jgi:hypothetical protein
MIQVDDAVQWTHVSHRGRSLSMQLRRGTVESITDGVALVRKASGRRESVTLVRLRRPDETTQITEFVEAVRHSGKPMREPLE